MEGAGLTGSSTASHTHGQQTKCVGGNEILAHCHRVDEQQVNSENSASEPGVRGQRSGVNSSVRECLCPWWERVTLAAS